MIKNFTCIVCPMGCSIDVETENNEIKSITGNTCKRGAEYVKSELINPMRTVTSTIKTQKGEIISVKTDRPIPKDKIFECMKIINNLKIDLKIAPGNVIIEKVAGTDADIVATSGNV